MSNNKKSLLTRPSIWKTQYWGIKLNYEVVQRWCFSFLNLSVLLINHLFDVFKLIILKINHCSQGQVFRNHSTEVRSSRVAVADIATGIPLIDNLMSKETSAVSAYKAPPGQWYSNLIFCDFSNLLFIFLSVFVGMLKYVQVFHGKIYTLR